MVSNLFIDEYMERANDAQIKIYLYLLRVMGAHRATSVSDLADRFNHTEKDVVRSLRYWEKQGLLNLRFGRENDLVSICLCRPSSSARDRSVYADHGAADRRVLSFSSSTDIAPEESSGCSRPLLMAAGGTISSQEKFTADHTYTGSGAADRKSPGGSMFSHSGDTPDDSAFFGNSAVSGGAFSSGKSTSCTRESGRNPAEGNALPTVPANAVTQSGRTPSAEDRRSAAPSGSNRADEMEALMSFRSDAGRTQLLFVIEQYIGKPLSLNEIRTIYNISVNLHFSDNMIDYLVQYCVDRGKKDFRYIGKVAENWAKEGIMTPAQAESYAAAAAQKAASGKNSSPAKATEKDGESRGRSGNNTGRARRSNSFNQFEQNNYDFDALEEELLASSK